MKTAKQKLTQKDISAFASDYLHNGRKDENWEITNIEIEGKTLTANVRMKSYYTSATDPGGFHLTIFTTLEFLSELTIILAHNLAGLKKKTREGWMLESSIVSKKAVRDPENIQVRMEGISMKKMGHNIIGVTKSKVFDSSGSFEVRIKAFLS
jgi:hypothetical protein